MFIKTDFEALTNAARDASDRGESPVIENFEQLRDHAMKRKILQREIVERTQGIEQRHIAYLALETGLMEGFYVVDMGRHEAWRWETEDEGETPYIANPPAQSESGLPKICGTCDHGLGPRFRDVSCSVHKLTLTTHHTCREWTVRSDLGG